jgi:hypothetical protein
VLALLDDLKDDPEEYDRRSVANNLNDIAKDHPAVVVRVAQQWSQNAGPDRLRLIRHGLRTLIKRGDPGALAVLGYGPGSPVRVAAVRIEPTAPMIGEKVRIQIDLENPEPDPHGALVDIVVHFVKANGSTSPKVFKGAERTLDGLGATTVSKTISLAQQSTRTHYPGLHRVEVQINGATHDGGEFELASEKDLHYIKGDTGGPA